jgi:hypothetical protein
MRLLCNTVTHVQNLAGRTVPDKLSEPSCWSAAVEDDRLILVLGRIGGTCMILGQSLTAAVLQRAAISLQLPRFNLQQLLWTEQGTC